MNRSAVAFVAVLGSMAGVTHTASAGVEIGGVAGFHLFADDDALGTKKNDDVHHHSSALFAGRVSVFFNKMLGVEVEGGAIPTESGNKDVTFDVWMATFRANLIAQFRTEPGNKFVPFATAGAGIMRIVDIGTTDDSLLRKDTDGMGWVGGGVKYRAGGGWGVRLDVRLLLAPSNAGKAVTPEASRSCSRSTRSSAYKAEKKASAEARRQSGQGRHRRRDRQVPERARGQGRLPGRRRLPRSRQRRRRHPRRRRQVPERGRGQGRLPGRRRLPGSGQRRRRRARRAGQVPDQPETKNGFQDEDGCPDEIPAKLKAFTGVIQGINFKVGSADLLPASNKVLDKAVAVLTEFPDLKLEIQGHTDDVAAQGQAAQVRRQQGAVAGARRDR